MNLKGVGNIFGAFITLGIVALIVARPQFLDITFKGASGLAGTLISPVTGRQK